MSMPETPMNPNWEPPPRRPGMSSGTKVLLIVLVVGGVLVVLCCGGLFISGYFFTKYVEKAASKDPAVVRQVASRIVLIDLPADFQPDFSLDMSVLSMAFAVFADRATGSTVTMAEFGEMYQQNQAQMQAQLEQQMRQQGMARQKAAGSVSSHQKQVNVRGEPVTFTFVESKEEGTGKKRLDVTGMIPGKKKSVMLMISVDAEKYDEARVTKMLESIR